MIESNRLTSLLAGVGLLASVSALAHQRSFPTTPRKPLRPGGRDGVSCGATASGWTDGRKPPDDPDQPRLWGYSVGHWERDRFLVESTGRDQRTWVDHFGYPHSETMHLEERYRRTNYNALELNWTITDPKVLTRPWVGQTKRFHLLLPVGIKTVDGWAGIMEDVCAPTDEVDQFDKRIRDQTGGGTTREHALAVAQKFSFNPN